jgi:hypothetical protein
VSPSPLRTSQSIDTVTAKSPVSASTPFSAKYDVATVARLMLEEVAELHPRRLTARELSARIITDPDDSREIETAAHAIRVLIRVGLFEGDDGNVRPTGIALFTIALLAT